MITDADREAAGWFISSKSGVTSGRREALLKMHDDNPLVQAFAAHRQAAIIEGARLMQEAATGVCEGMSCEVDASMKEVDDVTDERVAMSLTCDIAIGRIRALDPATVIKEAE